MQKISEYGNFEIDDSIYSKDEILQLMSLQIVLLTEEGLLCSIEECADIWSGYSSDLQASWLDFPKNIEEIIPFIKSNSYFISFEEYLK